MSILKRESEILKKCFQIGSIKAINHLCLTHQKLVKKGGVFYIFLWEAVLEKKALKFQHFVNKYFVIGLDTSV